jgi:heat shock protein HslJ
MRRNKSFLKLFALLVLLAAVWGPLAVGAAERQQDVLNGTSWRLNQLARADGALAPIPGGAEVTIAFADGTASGSGGCNRFRVGYRAEGTSLITWTGPIVATMMACEPDLQALERDFFATLERVVGFENAMGVLTLADAGEMPVAVFREVVPLPLTGTTWSATMVNNGREAVSPLVEGTSITAVFAEDGKLSGRACNTYMTRYSRDEGSISIEPPAASKMMCPDEKEMKQEQGYLLMLPKAASASIDGEKMELRMADGALIAAFVAAPPAKD